MSVQATDAGARQAVLDGTVLATLWGTGAPVPALASGRELTLSRFAWLRRQGGQVIAESAPSPARVVLEDPRAATLVFILASAQPLDEALAERAELPLAAVLELSSLLLAGSILVDPAQAEAEEQPPLAVWEFHDLLFHTRSRAGRQLDGLGGTYRFAGRFPIAPASPPSRWAETVALEQPDWDRIEQHDPPFALVQSRRRSIREYGESPLTLAQLGEFLYRVGRVEDILQVPPMGFGSGDPDIYMAKPYPSGGALYELELYVAVKRCDGLEPGLYHYAAERHALERAAGPSAALDGVILAASSGMGIEAESMQVVVVMATRMGRIAWKYQSIAYALVLKHVGVLMQTMYLAATAMGLAPCAVGTGDSDLFARASGIGYYEEAAVGEFALGSRPPA